MVVAVMEGVLGDFGKIRNLVTVTALSIALVACGGGSGGGGSAGGQADNNLAGTTQVNNTQTSDTQVDSVPLTTAPATDTIPPATTGGTTQQVGTASLSWQAPSQRTDGQSLALSDIGGYRVYYGSSSSQYQFSVDINDATATSFVVTNLPLGTYYVVLTTIDVNGLESSYSNEVVKVVQ
jgi:fibronectin type 3 domain-containing protein